MAMGVIVPVIADLAAEIGRHVSILFDGKDPGTALIGNVLHMDTMVSTLLIAAVLIAMGLYVRGQITDGPPTGLQNALEAVVEYIDGTAAEQVGESRVRSIAPMAVTLALFIALSNWVGLIPTGGLFKSPTADINTTLALALVAIGYVEIATIRKRGLGGFVAHFFHNGALLGPIEILIEFTKPITLAFRLFGNIAAGEIMLAVIASLPIAFQFFPGFAFNGVWVAFSIFVGGIQAFIFMMLTIAYYGQGVVDDEHAESATPALAGELAH